ncbi:MAG: hypothetical protein K2O32_01580 [Acetatifactor sp.]|nr:hypothetical protein [Acetatifactor sp.]
MQKVCEGYDLWIRAVSAGVQIKFFPEKIIYRILYLQSVTEMYKGKSTAISDIISTNQQYPLPILRIVKRIAIWGECERTKIAY